jgi:hypothetical protein
MLGISSMVNLKPVECDLPTNLWFYQPKSKRLLVTVDKSLKNSFYFIFSDSLLRDFFKPNDLNVYSRERNNSYNVIVAILKAFHHPRFY